MASQLREFLMLAHQFDGVQSVAGWLASPKLDGCRALWDGGITRGMMPEQVPWANTTKDGRYINPPLATGLWSRYGKPIQAPAWFLDTLPDYPLDGELYMGRGKFQELMSTIKQLRPDDRWNQVTYQVFDSPTYRELFANGEIRLKGKFEKKFDGVADWAIRCAKVSDPQFLRQSKPFEAAYSMLCNKLHPPDHIKVILQRELPYNVAKAKEVALEMAAEEVEKGGEGIIVRMPTSLWVPKRVRTMLKVKPYKDSEGVIAGYVWGEKTELGSKLLGLMGSVIVNWAGKTFRLSGFTEEERVLTTQSGNITEAMDEGYAHPGELASANIENFKFQRGTKITFQYRELTRDGYPKEARYWRKKVEE